MNVRKGTIAAFLGNAKIVSDESADFTVRASAESDTVDALPSLLQQACLTSWRCAMHAFEPLSKLMRLRKMRHRV
jgi:hypothetical protein